MITNLNSKVSYETDTEVSDYPIPFLFLDNSHIIAKLLPDDSETMQSLVYGTDFTLTGAGNASGGTLTLIAPPSGATLYIVRKIPINQLTNYIANGEFPEKTVESSLDKLTMICQELAQSMKQCVRVPNTEELPDLPNYYDRKYTVVGFDNNGDLRMFGFDPDSNSVVVYTIDITAGSVTTAKLDTWSVTNPKMKPDAYFYGTGILTDGNTVYELDRGMGTTTLFEGMLYRFKASAANPGAVKFRCLEVPVSPDKWIKKNVDQDLAANDIKAGQIVTVQFDGTNWQILSTPSTLKSTTVAITGAFKDVIIKNNTLSPNTALDISIGEVVLKDASGTPLLVTTLGNVILDITNVGLEGLDTLATPNGEAVVLEASSTWYYIWVVSNGTTNHTVILSASKITPRLSSAYTYKALIGAVYNNASSNFTKFYQRDRDVWTEEQVVFSTAAPAGSSMAGNIAALSGTALSNYKAFVPPIAKKIVGMAGTTTGFSFHLNMRVGPRADGVGATVLSVGATTTSYSGSKFACAQFIIAVDAAEWAGAGLYWGAPYASNSYFLCITGFSL